MGVVVRGKVKRPGLEENAHKEPGHCFTSSGVADGSESGSNVVGSVLWKNDMESTVDSYGGWGLWRRESRKRLPPGPPKASGTGPGWKVLGIWTWAAGLHRNGPFSTKPLQPLSEILAPKWGGEFSTPQPPHELLTMCFQAHNLI